MESKSLLFGIGGFILGGLLVSIAATTFDKPADTSMGSSLSSQSGDAYDAAFLNDMISHHQAALDMAQLSGERAKHPEIKALSQQIIATQQAEIKQMKQWQVDWNYTQQSSGHMAH